MGKFRPGRQMIKVDRIGRKIDLEVYKWAKKVWKREGFQSVEALLLWIYKGAETELIRARGNEVNEPAEPEI